MGDGAMTSQGEPGLLESELRGRLDSSGTNYVWSTTICFGDFLWDAGIDFEEVKRLDVAVIVDSTRRSRRFVVQRIRGELRYWLATERDPMAMSRTGEGELGVVSSVDDAVALCTEFLDGDVRIGDLKTPRLSGGLSLPKAPNAT